MMSNKKSDNKTSRRTALKVFGGGLIFAATGSTIFLTTRDPIKAREPWISAGLNETDPRRIALSYAILAPNPHNRQPWVIDLVGEDEVVLYCDKDRHLPITDPFDRQITIGLGAFIELFVIASAEQGYRVEVSPFPEGEPAQVLDNRPVAHLKTVRDDNQKADPLFAQIIERHSNKEAYASDRQIPANDQSALSGVSNYSSTIFVTSNKSKVADIRDIGVEAMRIEYVTPHTLGESIDLMRIGKSEILANPDGIDLGGAFLETLSLFGQLDREDMKDPNSYAWKTGLDMTLGPLKTGTAYGWLVSNGNTRADQLNAGRDYARFHLQATKLGIAVHPTSQALQEYPEMNEPFRNLHNLLEVTSPNRVQMLTRLGYAENTSQSPRWPLETRIRKA